jgi:trehalose 6-phosphate phosphatase
MGTSHPITDAAAAAVDSAAPNLPTPPSRIRKPALFLDLDGVLAPLAETPEAVVPHPRRSRVLRQALARFDGRVAIISGRTIAEIDRISDAVLDAASGVHGLERRRSDGSLHRLEPAEGVRAAVEAFEAFARERPGVIVEDKAVSAGLHFRQAREAGDEAMALARRLADRTGLVMQPGNLVVELKTPGTDKGTAIAAFMDEPPFAGAVPVMLGDDLTDEYGFRAADELGGFGILVGPARATAARYGLPDVDAVLDWLETLQEAA